MNSAKNKLIRIEEVDLKLEESEEVLPNRISAILGLPENEIVSFQVVKRNVDSRQRKSIRFVYSLDVVLKNIELVKNFDIRHRVRVFEPFVYEEKVITKKSPLPPFAKGGFKKIVVVGSGPSGLFAALLLAKAGLKPLLIERGKDIDARVKDVNIFRKEGVFNPQSNIQFGEGGAGTFSDGKLYTLINDPRSKYVFSQLIKAGAPEEISWNASPHIGTDKLREVIKNVRQEIISLGGEIKFESCLTDIKIEGEKLKAIVINGKEEILADDLVLATGHSARDTYEMLYERKLAMKAKPFSVGLRIEHLAEAINKSRYGVSCGHPKLPTAKYKLVQHLEGKRSVYTFCMCPGGYVMPAASEEGMVVTNGMSEYAQDGLNSNSALLVPVTPEDFGSDHPLAGIEFQRRWEKRAFAAGGSDYSAPAQLVGDFLKNISSERIGSTVPTYQPGIKLTSLNDCLPEFVIDSLREAIPLLNKKLKGFSDPEAILTGVETRSSSPVRIERNEKFESNIFGIYPTGEGAGYAGGIVSSAIDGMAVAEAIIEKYIKIIK